MNLPAFIKSKTFFYCLTLLLGGVGGIILGVSPMFGIVLIVIGVIGGMLSYIASGAKDKQGDYLFEAQALLLARQGVGNVYAEAVKTELKKTGTSKKAEDLMLKALEIEPYNYDALCANVSETFTP